MSSASQLGRDRPLVLVVMDGVGVGRGDDFDAVALGEHTHARWVGGRNVPIAQGTRNRSRTAL